MPYELYWVPPPTDASLPVLAEPPEGAEDWGFDGPKVIRVGRDRYHHCHRCAGWIPGDATESRVNTLGPLSGRCGVEFYCRRCGWEIAFSGMMS
jgi:hypothetical protein